MTFEEVAYLLWNGHLPSANEGVEDELQSLRQVPEPVLDLLGQLPSDFDPMAALRTGISLLSHYDPEANLSTRESN